MINATELAGFLPHADKMVWIDAVVECHEGGGTCLVVIDEQKHYCDEGGIRQSAYIEWMAQGFGFANAAFMKNQNTSIKTAFMVGFSNISFKEERPSGGEELLVITNVTRTIGPINYIEGSVKGKNNGVIYCEGQIKLFAN